MKEGYEHLKLPPAINNLKRQKSKGKPQSPKLPPGRIKSVFAREGLKKAEEISTSFTELKNKNADKINPSLIFEIKINQNISSKEFDKTLSSMGIHMLSISGDKGGYWIVFADDEELTKFKEKLEIYGQEEGYNYDFFNAIKSFRDIPVEKKIGERLKHSPLNETADFIDIELWRMTDPKKNEDFIKDLKQIYIDQRTFKITDILITNAFVLLRVKLTKAIFDELIEFKEIARADRPIIFQFDPFEYIKHDIAEFQVDEPQEGATGILIIDSGIISNHPMLATCVGGEENFQSGEKEVHDTIGHGTAVAGCAVYGDIEACFNDKKFIPFAGQIANHFPQSSGNFIKNMMLIGAEYPFKPDENFYSAQNKGNSDKEHINVCGFGLSSYEKAINSYNNRVVLWDENQIGLDQVKVYTLQIPDIFFEEKGKKKIVVVLTFNPKTRPTRGDSYLGNRMEFHFFHSIDPHVLINKYGILSKNAGQSDTPRDLKKFEMELFPGANTRKVGCHQKAWKEYKREPRDKPKSPISLVLLNYDKWIGDNSMQDYCISVTFEHEKEIKLYNQIRTSILVKVRV